MALKENLVHSENIDLLIRLEHSEEQWLELLSTLLLFDNCNDNEYRKIFGYSSKKYPSQK